jgi:hypothetical protein
MENCNPLGKRIQIVFRILLIINRHVFSLMRIYMENVKTLQAKITGIEKTV